MGSCAGVGRVSGVMRWRAGSVVTSNDEDSIKKLLARDGAAVPWARFGCVTILAGS